MERWKALPMSVSMIRDMERVDMDKAGLWLRMGDEGTNTGSGT